MKGARTALLSALVLAAIWALAGGTPSPSRGAPARLQAPATVAIQAGCYIMGEQRNYADERPAHEVCLSAFRLDRTEVTVAAFARCVAAKKCTPPQAHSKAHPTRRRCNWKRSGRGRHPVNCVTWAQARQYCGWQGGRLPTEAEWERAARPTKKEGRRRQGFDCRAAVLAQPGKRLQLGCGADGTRAVASSPADRSPAGVSDLTGNVSEWTADFYAIGIYRKSRRQDPQGAKRGRTHTVRGCSYQCVPKSRLLWPSARQPSATWDPSIGFRCARSAP